MRPTLCVRSTRRRRWVSVRGMATSPDDAAARPLADRPMSWPVVSTHDLHRDDWVVALREDVITRPGHAEEFSRITLEHPGAVVVLAVDDDERVMCLRQYRHTNRRELVGLPAGRGDAGRAPSVETAKRELRRGVEREAS